MAESTARAQDSVGASPASTLHTAALGASEIQETKSSSRDDQTGDGEVELPSDDEATKQPIKLAGALKRSITSNVSPLPVSHGTASCAAGRHCMADRNGAMDLGILPFQCMNCSIKMHSPLTCGEMFS